MNSLFTALVKGDMRERLAVIADLLSVVGVSIVALLAPLLSEKLTTDTWMMGLLKSSYCLVILAVLSALLALTATAAGWVGTRSINSVAKYALVLALWIMFAASILLAVLMSVVLIMARA